MAYTAKDFINNFASRLGDSGKHVWDFYHLPKGTAWCAAEISYTFNKIGAKSKWYGGNPVFYVPYAQQWMAKNYKLIYSGPNKTGNLASVKAGDIVIFSWTQWSRDHIGAVYKDGYSNEEIRTIEGNTSGSKVDTRTREKKYIHSVYRPNWSNNTKTSKYMGILPSLPQRGWIQRGDSGQDVVYLQMFLNWALDFNLALDGECGPKTTRAIFIFQSTYGLNQDGGFGKECLAKAKSIRR